MRWVMTRTGFYADGQLHSMSNALEFLRFPPLGLLDKLRLGATIVYASRITDWRRLERIPVGTWLSPAGPAGATFERFWLPLLRSKLGESWSETSAAFIWATIARLYAARRSGLKSEMFGYLPGRLRPDPRPLRGVAARSRAWRSDRATPVARIGRGQGARLEVELASGERRAFDRVVVTLAAPLAARLCPDLAEEELTRLRGVRYLGIVCASVVLDAPLAGYYVTNITDPWVPFTGVIEMTALVDPAELGGRHLVYLPKYVAEGDPAFTAPDDEVEEQFLAALERMYPRFRRSQVLAFRVSRVRCVCAVPTLRYSERAPAMTTSVPGLFLLGSAHIVNGTLNVNETVRLAEDAVEEMTR